MLSHKRTSLLRNRWQLSRVIFTACLPSLIHCSAWVKHARYYWLLLAEGHLTRGRFASMLQRITLCRFRRANIWEVAGAESPILTQEGAVSEKSAGNDVDYAAKSRMARHRAVLRWLMQFWLATSLPSSTMSAIQSWKKEIPVKSAIQVPIYVIGIDV